MKSVFTYTGIIKKLLGQTDFFFGLNITLQVMAITDVSAAYKYPVTPPLKGFQDKGRIDATGTHDAYCPEIGRVLEP
jgi:hypothetical protein